VYPNPVDDILNIYTATEQVVSLYNAAGSLVWKAKLPAGRNQLPVNKLSKGVYILATNQLKTRIIIR
jgi:glucose dehydrogenase